MEPEEISTSPDIKELDIVTLYVFYAIFSKNEDYVGNIRNVVLRMKLYVGQYSKLWRDYFDYFLQVIDSYMRGSGAGSENHQGDAAAAFAPVYGLHPGTGI